MALALSGSNYCKLTNNFTLGPLDINNPYGTAALLNMRFSNALITYSNTTLQQRRYNGGAQFTNNIYITSNITIPLDPALDINCNVTYTISNLLPDMTYTFNVAVNTTYNSNYGIVSSNATPFKTLLPPYSSRLATVSQCNSGLLYTRQGFNIGAPTIILNILCNAALVATGGLCNVINNRRGLAILTDNNPRYNITGDAPNDQAQIIVTCGLTDSNIFILRTWAPTLSNGPAIKTAASGFSIINIGSQQQDPYAGNQRLSNFYLQASNVSVIIKPSFLQASNQPYRYSIIHSNAGYSNITITFSNIYVDNLTQLASVVSLINNGESYKGKYISGLFCLSNDQIYKFNLNLQNFASNFLPACNILISTRLSYTSLNNNTYYSSNSNFLYSNTTLYDTSDTPITSGSVPTQVRLKLSNIDLSGNGDSFLTTSVNSQITASIIIENLVGTSSNNIRVPYYFDTLSLNNLSINHSNSYAIGGEHYLSYLDSYITTFTVYDENQVIINNTTDENYNSELPLVGGFYTTGSYINDSRYFNSLVDFVLPADNTAYPDYSGINTEITTRYATFKYSLSNSSNIQIKALEFNMNSAALFSNMLELDSTFNTTQVPTLHYKVYNVSNDTNSPINTGWLNGNSFLDNDEPLTEANVDDGNPGLLPSSGNYSIDGIKRYWNIIPIPSNTSYDVYVKIGLRNLENLYFDYIYLISKYITVTGIFQAPTNGQFNVITPPTDVRISWSNITQSAYDYTTITGNYNDSFDSTYPRRVVGASKYIDDPINDTSDSSEYVTTLLNADTYYDINLRNIGVNAESSDLLSFIGKTDLPLYTYCNFYDGNMKFKFFKQSDDTENIYFTNCNAYFIRSGTRTLVANIISKQSLSIKLVRSSTEVYTPFIINYSNSSKTDNYPGPGLSDFTISANINTNIANFTFNSTYFLLPYIRNQEFTSNENNIQLLFQNSGDMAINIDGTIPNDAYTGFFYKSALTVKTLDTLKDGSNNIRLYNNDGCNYSQSFFVDSGTIAPTVNKMFVDSNGLSNSAYYTYVSGVLVFRTVTACNYNFWMQTSNLNSNFIMPTPITFALRNSNINISNLLVNGATIPVYSAPNTGSELTNSFINANNNTFFSWPNVSLNSLSNIGPANTLSNSGTASNLFGGSATVQQQLATQAGGLLYFDNESLRTIALTSDSNFYYSANADSTTLTALNNYPNAGQKVISGSGSNPGSTTGLTTFGCNYVHSSNIITGIYSNELQIVNGYFTGSNQYSYLNYTLYYSPLSANSDYRTITTTNNIRWTTFMWYIPKTDARPTTNYAIINFIDHNFTSRVLQSLYSFNNIYFLYKIQSSNAGNTSGWLDGNLRANPVYRANSILSNSGAAGGIPAGTNIISTSNTRSIVLRDSTSAIGRTPYNLYIRIGIPANSNFYFKNIQLSNIYQQ
jgi:hypothetical protein